MSRAASCIEKPPTPVPNAGKARLVNPSSVARLILLAVASQMSAAVVLKSWPIAAA